MEYSEEFFGAAGIAKFVGLGLGKTFFLFSVALEDGVIHGSMSMYIPETSAKLQVENSTLLTVISNKVYCMVTVRVYYRILQNIKDNSGALTDSLPAAIVKRWLGSIHSHTV